MTIAQSRDWMLSCAAHEQESGHRPRFGLIPGGGWVCPALFCDMWDTDMSELTGWPYKPRPVRSALIGTTIGLTWSLLLLFGHWPWSLAVLAVFGVGMAYTNSDTHLRRSSRRNRAARHAKWRARFGGGFR